MKRFISCMLILLMLFLALPASASAKKPELYLDTTYGVVGETVTVDVYIKDLPNCAGYGIFFSYDPKVLKPIDYENKHASNSEIVTEVEEGTYAVAWLDDTTKNPIKGNLLLGTLKFKVLAKAKIGSTVIEIAPKTSFAASATEEIDVEKGSCVLTIYEKHSFADVKNQWFKEAVLFVYNHELMNGMSETTFAPSEPTTRAQLVTVLYRMEGEPTVSGKTPFKDIQKNWYKNAVLWAYQNGIVKGTTDTTFSPDDPITREQIATIFYRYAESVGHDVGKKAPISDYPDAKNVSSYAKDALGWAVEHGIVTGVLQQNGQTTLSPKDSATRAQIATIMMRYIKIFAES